MTDISQKKKLFCKLGMTLDVLIWAIQTCARDCERNTVVQLHPDSSRLQLLETDSNCQTPTCDSFALVILYPSPAQTLGSLVWKDPVLQKTKAKQNKPTPPNLKCHPANFRLMLHLNNSHILLVLEFQQPDDHPSRNTVSYHSVLSKWSLLG